MALPEKAATKTDAEPAEYIPELGSWYWMEAEKHVDGEKQEVKLLSCVVHVGTNYVLLETPEECSYRVHFDNFPEWCELEPDAEKVIKETAQGHYTRLRLKIDEINEVTKRLGLSQVKALPESSSAYALVPLHGTEDLDKYKNELVLAKETRLPALFKEVEKINENLATWLAAEALPMRALAERLKGSIEVVDDRIFHVSLYAGLVEDVKHVRRGKAAGMGDKLHVMQRRHYMDEECLIAYETGGMNFQDLKAFDRWISKVKNLERILPFPKCAVSFQVRRERKDYHDVLNPFIKINLEQDDKLTFLYIRNGRNLYRLNVALNLGKKLFPNTAEFNPGEKMWAKMEYGDRVDEIIPDRLYKQLRKDEIERKKLSRKWEKDNPKKHHFDNPHRDCRFHKDDYKPFDPSTVYFDDITEEVANEAKQYNRIALILQGLFDRSMVLHPHPPVQVWKRESFAENVCLVYDYERALYQGPRPDFEAYRSKLNRSIKAGSIVVGQEDFWERKEADKENDRQGRDWRVRNQHYYKKFKPCGNPGPGLTAEVTKYLSKAKKCRFAWYRERLTPPSLYQSYRKPENRPGEIRCTLTVPVEKLLHINAYKPDDFKQFYADPRTRADYLEWAPLLLAAEDYHAAHPELKVVRSRRVIKRRRK